MNHNIGVIARVPFERGLLAGRFTHAEPFGAADARTRMFSGKQLPNIHAAIRKLEFLDNDCVTGLAEAVLRFILSNPSVSTVIPGIRSVAQAKFNARVAGKRLSSNNLAKLREFYLTESFRLPHH